MKRVKRLISILLVAVMMLAMTTTAFAATGTTYSIEYNTPSNGTVSGDASADEGESFTITVAPESGYVLDTLTVSDNEGTLTATASTSDTYTYTMRTSDVEVTATFAQAYSISISDNIENGTVSADVSSAKAGDTVTLTVVPYTGYELDELTVSTASYTSLGTNTYTFTMPSSDVTVTATFEKTTRNTYVINVENETAGYTYVVYQIFKGDLNAAETTLSNITWGTGITDAGKTALINKYCPDNADATAADVAAAIVTANNAQELAELLVATNSNYLQSGTTMTYDNASGTYYASELAAGYYLVINTAVPTGSTDTAYSNYIVQLVKDVTIEPKWDVPTVEKKVLEESYTSSDSYYGTGYNDVADYDIGDNVPFELIGTLPSNLTDYDTYYYVFHDTIVNGLTFNSSSVEVKVVTGSTTTIVPDVGKKDGSDYTNYTVVTNPTDCTFEVVFDNVRALYDADGNLITVDSSSKIYVYYTAKLSSSATIGLNGNVNKVYLEYSNNPNNSGSRSTGKTPEDKVIVFTYELDVTKVDATDNTKTLANAEFRLMNSEKTLYAQFDSDGKVTGWTSDTTDTTIVLKSDSNGVFKIIGLDDGTYYLKETKAPDGYSLLSNPIKLVVEATTTNGQNWTSGVASEALTALEIEVDGTTSTGNTSTGLVTATVENKAGSVFPVTGGMGTTILYIIGAILVIGAGVLLVTRRRLSR